MLVAVMIFSFQPRPRLLLSFLLPLLLKLPLRLLEQLLSAVELLLSW
jgi:hypothetical protein